MLEILKLRAKKKRDSETFKIPRKKYETIFVRIGKDFCETSGCHCLYYGLKPKDWTKHVSLIDNSTLRENMSDRLLLFIRTVLNAYMVSQSYHMSLINGYVSCSSTAFLFHYSKVLMHFITFGPSIFRSVVVALLISL